MKIRTNKSTFFFFFIILFSFCLSFIPTALAGEIDNPIITTDILAVQVGGFQDTTTDDGRGKIDISKGGYDLISFENMGMVPGSYDEVSKQAIYRARVVFGFEVNAWTSATFNDIYPKINIDNTVKTPYLQTAVWHHIGLHILPIGAYLGSSKTYSIEYRSIDYGTTTKRLFNIFGILRITDVVDVPNSYLLHDYHGTIPTTITISPGLRFSGAITVGGQTFSVPTLTSDIIYTQIKNVRGGEAGGYEDRYSDQGMDTASVLLTLADKNEYSTTIQKIVDWFNDGNVGRIANKKNESITIQQSIIDKSHSNDRYDSINIGNSFSFNIPVHIRPGVTKLRNYFDLTTGTFRWFADGHWNMNPSITTKTIQRDVSVSVQNVFIHYDFEVISDLFMTTQFTAELSQSFLNDPNLEISDMIWDKSIWGDKIVEIVLTKTPSIWDILIMILTIVAIIVVAYFVFKYLRSRRRKQGRSIQIFTGSGSKKVSK
ncbi:hypothetical protein LCGC14_1093470 [marine sediment metagenome]|uniref:Uncharacterized protein n=1 Tax=marine sediment metagenome TaxID=412755 RepID=A0A0F9MG24_9ZZZZ